MTDKGKKIFEELMNERYIIKNKNRELYYAVKDSIPEIKEFVNDKLGYRIIQNQTLIKLEKLPGEAEGWMGIREFESTTEYIIFCVILMFLEDKEPEEQFVLSQLTEYIAANYPKNINRYQDPVGVLDHRTSLPFQTKMKIYDGIDWTVYEHRRRLVRVMKYCIKQHLFLVNDGNEEGFQIDAETEVLYENTGVSKYFMKNFMQDISGYQNVSDFFRSDWVDMNEDRGIVRRQRVYRKLLLSMGVYKKEDVDEDFAYIKQYHNVIEGDFENVMDCNLQIHRAGTFLLLGEDTNLGTVFPANNSVSDAILLFFSMLREKREKAELTMNVNEIVEVSLADLELWVKECKKCYGHGFAKKYREEMSDQEFAELLINSMEQYGMININQITDRVEIYPIAGKICGGYIDENK